jgi:hypothetical protein
LDKYENLEENHGEEWTKLKWFKGQALFFRAYNYFMGLQMWGPIPLVLTPPDGSNHTNSTVPELYNQAIADLLEIVDNGLCPEFNQIENNDLGRITMGAAKSLLAKVYLTRAYSEAAESSDIQNAVNFAKDVVENSGYGLITEPDLDENGDTLFTAYEKPFLPEYKNSIEGIWEYQFVEGAGRSKLNEEYAPPGYFGNWGKARFEATPLLYNSFESGDTRKKVYITGEVVSPESGEIVDYGDKIYMVKFHDPDYSHTAGNLENNFPFIRFADMLLIYAEALNQLNSGPTQEAYDAINRVRNRAGLPDLSGSHDYESFLKAVQDERFKELAGEGQRLYDLRRWGFNTLKERVELSNSRASVEAHEVLWPIPSYELGMNPEINQNAGY